MISFAQNQVSGLVIDSTTREAMLYVNIAVLGSTYGTVSNQNGEFTISLDKINQSDSIAFHFIGYETKRLLVGDLKDDIVIEMREQAVKLREVTILANPVLPEELIKKALERKAENYPSILQKREVFKRRNNATYVEELDISLEKSNIEKIDSDLVSRIIDSVPTYTRNYSDYLYNLYSFPDDSLKKNKGEAIKGVFLKEDDGGDLDQIEETFTELLNNNSSEGTFWKIKSGVFSQKIDDIDTTEPIPDSIETDQKRLDSLSEVRNISRMYSPVSREFLNWDWDFIQKMGRYDYEIEGVAPILGEYAYAIRFTAKGRGDYKGMIYISKNSYAILRIEYSLKERKKEGGLKLLGIRFREMDDSGLLLYARDDLGYYLKYSMSSDATIYGIHRPVELIRKKDRRVFNKRVNHVKLFLNLVGREETVRETLIVFREGISKEDYSLIQEKLVEHEQITSYSDSIWNGYSIIEPTKQMKEYKAKVKK